MRTLIALAFALSSLSTLADQTFVTAEATLLAINNHGQAVGTVNHHNGTESAIMFDGTIHEIATAFGTEATDINDHGEVLYNQGHYSYLYNCSTQTSTFICGQATDVTQHTDSLNNNGMIIGNNYRYSMFRDTWGFFCTASNPTPVPLPNHQPHDDPMPPFIYATDSSAGSLNDAGIVVGCCSWWPGDVNPYQNVACYWTGTTVHKLGTLGYSSSAACAINDSGDIVGWLRNASGQIEHAFLYSGGTMHELTRFTDWPTAMNNAGIIIGEKTFYDNGAVGNFLDLMPPGWSNVTATDINNSNQVCGYATGPDGLTHGFILTVPEPATLSLLALGGIALLRRRK